MEKEELRMTPVLGLRHWVGGGTTYRDGADGTALEGLGVVTNGSVLNT